MLTNCCCPPQAEWALDAAEWWWENWSWSQMLNYQRKGWEGGPLPGSRAEVPLAGEAWCGGPQQWESPWCHMSGCGRGCSHHMCTCYKEWVIQTIVVYTVLISTPLCLKVLKLLNDLLWKLTFFDNCSWDSLEYSGEMRAFSSCLWSCYLQRGTSYCRVTKIRT